MENTDQRLRALPVQLIEIPNGILLKRGSTEFQIVGERAAEVVQIVLAAAEGGEVTSDGIEALFAECDRPAVGVLIQELRQRNIIIDERGCPPGVHRETAADIFYWHFGLYRTEVNDRLSTPKIAVLGVNCISRQLAAALNRSGVTNVDLVDVRLLRNLRLFDENDPLYEDTVTGANHGAQPYAEWQPKVQSAPPDCIVATSDFGGQHLLREWNLRCLEHRIMFLPVVLQDLIGYVGPMVIPGHTACLECLRARQNAALTDPAMRRAAEARAFEGQAITGCLPSMASILGDIAAVELIKFYSGLPQFNIGRLVELNMLTSVMTPRKVLRVPRCTACSTLNRVSPVMLTDNLLVESNRGSG
jgi:bacteriocin biosynthesis cyclodehydratase domain-containing protein